MKKPFFTLLALAVLFMAADAFSQKVFNVISLDGSAKVQRMGKKNWDKLSVGSQVRDNDIVETFFQTRLVMHFGKDNAAILGSNSKVLFNIREQPTESGATGIEANLTLFAGGCFIKAISNCHISMFTSNATGETDNGSFSTAVELKTGETVFQTLGGSIKARNIAQKEGITLTPGQSTTIFTGKEPAAPLYITVRHALVLKHSFGEDYIESELGAAGIKPTEDKSSGPTGLSQNMASQQQGTPADQARYKQPFSLNRIWGAILDDREKYGIHCPAIGKPDLYNERRFVVEESNVLTLARDNLYSQFILTPSFSSHFFEAGLRLPVAANYTSRIAMYNFSSLAGALDLIDHVNIGLFEDSTFLKIGPVNNFTIGNGLIVDGYNNYNPYSLFHPLGATLQAQLGDWTMQGFVADLSSFSLGGAHLLFEPNIYHLGAGYFYDANKYDRAAGDSVGYRFVNLPGTDSGTIRPGPATPTSIYQLDFSADVVANYDLKVVAGAEFAQKLVNFHNDGFVLRAPVVSINWQTLFVKGDFTAEMGRLVAGQFNSFYMSNRARVISTAALHDTLLTQNGLLSDRKSTGKLELFFGISPVKGTALNAFYKQNIFDRHPLAYPAADSLYSGPDLSLGLSFSVNDSLWRPLKYAAVYFQETHGGLYPPKSIFPSWGLAAGFDAVTNPILFGVGLSAGVSWYYLDMNADNKIDAQDNVIEFSLGLRYGFL
jgi:hypothetical protein